jgi:hypothetical protein
MSGVARTAFGWSDGTLRLNDEDARGELGQRDRPLRLLRDCDKSLTWRGLIRCRLSCGIRHQAADPMGH